MVKRNANSRESEFSIEQLMSLLKPRADTYAEDSPWQREHDNRDDALKGPTALQIQMANEVLAWTLEAGLTSPRFEQDAEDDILTLTWRESNFDLFINLTDDGEMFGYYRQRRLNGIELDSAGEDLNSAFEIKICVKNIGVNFMPTILRSSERSFSSTNVSV